MRPHRDHSAVGRPVLGPRLVLASFYGVGAALLLLVAVSPWWSVADRPVLLGLGVGAGAVSAGIAACRRLPRPVEHALLVAGSGVVATAVHAAGGGVPSAAIATFAAWVVTYAALFLRRRLAALHGVLAATLTAVALGRLEPAGSAALEITLLVVVTTSTGVIVEALTRSTRQLATTDALTGLLNEAGLARVVSEDLRSAASGGAPGLLLLIDLDRFGDFNQAFGRDGGDELLRAVAHASRTHVDRAGGHVARLGGDDFAVWLPSVPAARTSREHAEALLEDVVGQIDRFGSGPFLVDDVAVEVDLTFGAALTTGDGETLGTLLHRADTALHVARATDRTAQLWSPELEEVTAESVELLTELRAAIGKGELRLHYQPLVSGPSREVVGVEALVRWEHPRLGLLPPAAFLPAAERTSAIVHLTDWVLQEALAQAARWRAAGRPLRVSVNLSARLLGQDGLAGQVRTRLAEAGVPPSLLTLEVTESAVTAQPRRAAATLAELRELGVRIALDDFGTGYTSLSMLQDLPFDELKVDKLFVGGALRRSGDLAIVRSVVELAHRLGFEVVAEGVEDDEVCQLLTELGYDLLQGYHFSRPVPAAHIPGLSFLPAVPVQRAVSPARERARALAADRAAAGSPASDPVLDALTAVAARVLDAPYALVTLLGESQQHVLSSFGAEIPSAPRQGTFCSYALDGPDLLEVPDASLDPRFSDHPMVAADLIRSYAGAPLADADGQHVGMVCVLDQVPRRLTEHQREVLRGLAATASAHLAARTERASAPLERVGARG